MTNEIFKNEMMSDEQLEQVAGGTDYEINYDNDLLEWFGFQKKYFSVDQKMRGWDNYVNSVVEAWSKVGITCKYHEHGENEYYLNNSDGSKTALSHDDAGDYVRRNFEALY